MLASWWIAKDEAATLADKSRLAWQSSDFARRRDVLVARLLAGEGLAAEPEPADSLAALLGRADQQGGPTAAAADRDAASEPVDAGNADAAPPAGRPADAGGESAADDVGSEPTAPGEVAGSPWDWLASQSDMGDDLGDR